MNGQNILQVLEDRVRSNPKSLLFARLADEYLKYGRIHEAIELCLQGVKQQPSYITGHFILAKAYVANEELEKAEMALKKVLAHDRQHLAAQKMLGDMMVRMGWENKAAIHYQDVLNVDPMLEDVRRTLSSLAGDEFEKPFTQESPGKERREDADRDLLYTSESNRFNEEIDLILREIPHEKKAMQAESGFHPMKTPSGDSKETPKSEKGSLPECASGTGSPECRDAETGQSHDAAPKKEESQESVNGFHFQEITEELEKMKLEMDEKDSSSEITRESREKKDVRPNGKDIEVLADELAHITLDLEENGTGYVENLSSEETHEQDRPSPASDERTAEGWVDGPSSGHGQVGKSPGDRGGIPLAYDASPEGPAPDSVPDTDLKSHRITGSRPAYKGSETAQGKPDATPLSADGVTERKTEASGRKKKPSESLTMNILSPTLGEIYAAQGQYAKAINVYKNLLLKYPGEARYILKIEELNKKLAESTQTRL